jgi:hypothetical protein
MRGKSKRHTEVTERDFDRGLADEEGLADPRLDFPSATCRSTRISCGVICTRVVPIRSSFGSKVMQFARIEFAPPLGSLSPPSIRRPCRGPCKGL